MRPRRPELFVQVDVDGLWAVRTCYGRAEGDTYKNDPVWEEGVPALASMFTGLGIPAAFFVVGRDLELAEKKSAASALWYAGFEGGNHSYSHTIGMTRMPVGEMVEEIRRTDALLRESGADPVGFRSPGYDVDARLLMAVRRCGYRYDASFLPTRLASLLRMVTRLVALRWDIPPTMFGRATMGELPRVPYFPDPHRMRRAAQSFEEARLMEFPVGVTTGIGMPMTGSSLMGASRAKLRAIFESHARVRRPLLLLFHGIDAVDCRRPIVFDNYRPPFGGFAMTAKRKRQRIEGILQEALRHYRATTAPEYLARMIAG